MHSFLMSSTQQQDIANLDTRVCNGAHVPSITKSCMSQGYSWPFVKIHETVEQINSIKLQREFYLGFSDNPQKFINEWLASQSRDLKVKELTLFVVFVAYDGWEVCLVLLCCAIIMYYTFALFHYWNRLWRTPWEILRPRGKHPFMTSSGALMRFPGTSMPKSTSGNQNWKLH